LERGGRDPACRRSEDLPELAIYPTLRANCMERPWMDPRLRIPSYNLAVFSRRGGPEEIDSQI